MKQILYLNEAGRRVAGRIESELKGFRPVPYKEFEASAFSESEAIVFVGALGVCVRLIAPLLRDKHSDPAVVCVDSMARNVISVLSGHAGGANALCSELARILGANPVITTQSDNAGLWPLDLLAERYGWVADTTPEALNRAIAVFVNGEAVGFLADVRDRGTDAMEASMPSHVRMMDDWRDTAGLRLVIAVTPYRYPFEVPVLYYRPRVLHLGVGCRRGCRPDGIADHIGRRMTESGLSPLAVRSVSTIDLKKDEILVSELTEWAGIRERHIYTADELAGVSVSNPSEKVCAVTGVAGVAEACARKAAGGGRLVLEKQKGKLQENSDFTFAVAVETDALRGGHIEIVGAGPGDPELVSLRGKRFLERADLILYAGSLVPKELTHYAKPGCLVRSSASMTLEEQFALMKEFYDRGRLVVRLHTGDPCIYGAIQEQMALFDRQSMSYGITPGISSFQAAAAALRSQFTIPEKVQTIILTRGEGRTPMPEREQLHKLAASRSTMCIFLSAGIADEVQRELLQEYPPETPVAVCYKLTWKEERIFRGVLRDLARIVRENRLTLTTLLVVGEAIGNRSGLSCLYESRFKHLFRQ